MNLVLGKIEQALFWCSFGIGRKKFYMAMDWYARSVKPVPVQRERSAALSATCTCMPCMVVECESLIYYASKTDRYQQTIPCSSIHVHGHIVHGV